MPTENPEIMMRARRARDWLVSHFIDSPDVVLIDIGFPSDADVGNKKDEIVVRIHVRQHWFTSAPEERLNFPTEIEGVRVIVVPGDYHLDSDIPELGN